MHRVIDYKYQLTVLQSGLNAHYLKKIAAIRASDQNQHGQLHPPLNDLGRLRGLRGLGLPRALGRLRALGLLGRLRALGLLGPILGLGPLRETSTTAEGSKVTTQRRLAFSSFNEREGDIANDIVHEKVLETQVRGSTCGSIACNVP